MAECSISQHNPTMNSERASYEVLRRRLYQIEEELEKLDRLEFGETEGFPRLRINKMEKLVIDFKGQLASFANRHRWRDVSTIAGRAIDDRPLPNLHKNSTFEHSPAFQDIQVLYDSLDIELKLCLLCFSVFPENAIIKKRVMVYWWIGEGFAPPIPRDQKTAEEIANGKTAEEFANEYFDQLMEKGFIEPVYKMHKLAVDGCKMHPFVRSAVIMVADRAKFFDFDDEGNAKHDYSHSLRACLTGRGLTNIRGLEALHALFNVNECILEFETEWFAKMKNINVLYLGRWQTSATHHIEVEGPKFLHGLENMKHLRFLSLRGISRISKLPDALSKLVDLMILDLRACHNLSLLPERISSLKNLTHLDISDCYFLNHMPKGFALLSELQVLKGFVIGGSKRGNSCTLDDLAGLPKMRKLSIRAAKEECPTDRELNALRKFTKLRKLTIQCGPGVAFLKAQTSKRNQQDRGTAKSTAVVTFTRSVRKIRSTLPIFFGQDNMSSSPSPALPMQLEKLDLRCFPRRALPRWLMPSQLKSLKKLYIRGGKLQDLGQFQELDETGSVAQREEVKCAVEILRLKYLRELEMDWRELQGLFPNLIYLERVECPKLSFFPCNERGVWKSRAMKLK